MKKNPRPKGMMINLLPAQLRDGLKELEAARDDDSVTAAEWHRQADVLLGRAATMPAPIRDAFNRAVSGLARSERAHEQRTGRLVGLPADADHESTRLAESELRRQVKSGELSVQEAEALRRRLSGE